MAGFGNSVVPPKIAKNMELLIATNQEHQQAKISIDLDIWNQYDKLRPNVASTLLEQENLRILMLIKRNHNQPNPVDRHTKT